MAESLSPDQIFIRKLTEIILANLGNENFGVSELAHETGMSLYLLNRRLHSITKKTSNQFIREIKLQKALEMLQNEVYTVAEIAYKTGFGSSNYFNKCFHEYFGYSPGKIKKGGLYNHDLNSLAQDDPDKEKTIWRKYILNLPGILLIIIIAGLAISLLYNKNHKSEWSDGLRSKDGKISIAIFPFRNLTNDPTWNIWQEGMQTSFISFLTNTKELLVRGSVNELIQSKGITDYASLTPSIENNVSQKLDANVYISGSIINSGGKIRVIAQIFDALKEEAVKSFEVEGAASGDMIFQIVDSLRHQVNDFLVVTKLKKNDRNSVGYFFDPIRSPEAYRYMVSARKAATNSDFGTAINMYKEAIRIDSTIYDAYSGIAMAFGEQGDWNNCKKWLLRYYSKSDKMDAYNKIFANYLFAITFKTPYDAIRYVEQLIDLSDLAPYNFVNLGDEYNRIFLFDKAIPEYDKALKIQKRMGISPGSVTIYTELGKAFHNTGQYRKEKNLYKNAEHDFPDNPALIARQAILSLACEDSVAANQYIKNYKLLRRNNSWSEAKIFNGVAVIYSRGGDQMKAEEYYRLANLKEPGNAKLMNDLGFFLINENRNVEEGLSLIDKALKINPDDYSLLDSKGWGLYKKGKHQEALELMKRSWGLRLQNSRYDHAAYLRFGEVKKAAFGQN